MKPLKLDLFFTLLLILLLGSRQISYANDNIQLKQYESGGIYEGEFNEGKQHGKGKYSLPNGYVYEGEWLNGKIEGKGKAQYPDG